MQVLQARPPPAALSARYTSAVRPLFPRFCEIVCRVSPCCPFQDRFLGSSRYPLPPSSPPFLPPHPPSSLLTSLLPSSPPLPPSSTPIRSTTRVCSSTATCHHATAWTPCGSRTTCPTSSSRSSCCPPSKPQPPPASCTYRRRRHGQHPSTSNSFPRHRFSQKWEVCQARRRRMRAVKAALATALSSSRHHQALRCQQTVSGVASSLPPHPPTPPTSSAPPHTPPHPPHPSPCCCSTAADVVCASCRYCTAVG